MLNLVIFGPPGAGKGTQSQKLIEKYQLIHLSTGDMLRAEIQAGTPLGLRAKELMDNGILVPDEVVIGMIDNKLKQNQHAAGFIFDGFPRTVAQAEALDRLMAENNTKIHAVIALNVSETELKRRIAERQAISNRPDDDGLKVIKRIEEYFNKTVHVLPYYEKQGKLSAVNGIGEIDRIFSNLCREIEKPREA